MTTCIKIYKQNKNFQFGLIAANGDEVLTSELSLSLKECNRSIAMLKLQSQYLHNYCKLKNDNDQYYFIINDDKLKRLAKSYLFWSESSRNYAMEIVKRECFAAEIKHSNK